MEHPLRVLLVEDSDDEAFLTLRELRTGGFDVTHTRVFTSETLRAALAERGWDVILCDYHMPELDFHLALSLCLESVPGIPIIVVSAAIGEELAVETMKAGADDYVLKHNLRRLCPVVERALREAEVRRGRRQAELALEESYHKLSRLLDETINIIAGALDIRDPYTAGHQRRVAALCVAIGKQMGLASDDLRALRLAALVHDIGKLCVPAEILCKPTRLSTNEFALIKNHAQVGYDLLHPVEFPWPIAEIVYQHHERLDGSGYPRGLKGPEILALARIVALADVVEAMASQRPYRQALGIEAALEEAATNRGKLYDCDVVDACLNVFSCEFTWD